MEEIVFLKRDVMDFYENLCYNIEMLIRVYYTVDDTDKKKEMKAGIIPQILILEEFRRQFNLKDYGDFDDFLEEHGVRKEVNYN